MVLLLLTVTTWSPQMLFGECDRALRGGVASNGRHPSLAKATTAPQLGAGSGDRPRRAGHADPDARRPAVSLVGEEVGRMRSGENDPGGPGRDRPCLEPGEMRRLMNVLS